MASSIPKAPFSVLRSAGELRQWRGRIFSKRETVGFVPTMGALHEGHINLDECPTLLRGKMRKSALSQRDAAFVFRREKCYSAGHKLKHSLSRTDHTIVSIFVNPAQFAPHEDLQTYPRMLESDIDKLASLEVSEGSIKLAPTSTAAGPQSNQAFNPKPSETVRPGRKVAALFLPTTSVLYPSGIVQEVSKQVGAFVEMKGFSHQMEGHSRPDFFRGVATVVTKLFNLVQPDLAFFGQKDIQQAVLLRQLITDLHLPHPPTPKSLVIVPTVRDTSTGLALSSRNKYLRQNESPHADVLWRALQAATQVYRQQRSEGSEVDSNSMIAAAWAIVEKEAEQARSAGVELRLDYIAVNDPSTLQDLGSVPEGQGAIVSGAAWLGKTRLIDNVVLDYELN